MGHPLHDPRQRHGRIAPIKYRAKQVIIRDETQSFLPTGTNFIGKLLSAIDTRNQGQWVKAILPHGGKFKDRGHLPKDTILMGTINYPGKGKKVFINFSKGILPSGHEFSLQAQVLDSKNHAYGISGTYHSRRGSQIASVLGLSMISGMTEVLTEKKALGETKVVAPKATIENAFYHGVSKVADMEAKRQASELGELAPYVTVPAGESLIIGLTSPIKGGFLENESQ